jgi:hypothetical protein
MPPEAKQLATGRPDNCNVRRKSGKKEEKGETNMPNALGAAGQTGATYAQLLIAQAQNTPGLTVNVAATFNAGLQPLQQTAWGQQFANQASATATTPGSISIPGVDMSKWDAKMQQIASIGAALDQMEKQAMELMKSPNKEDQLKGQQMLQMVNQIFEAISKAIQQAGEKAKSAIEGSSAR